MRPGRIGTIVRGIVFAVVVPVLVGALPAVAKATMTVRAYDATRHDRFYSGVGKDFIAQDYDLSGVGKVLSTNRWGTMISPSYFLSARHWQPAIGDTMTFYETNDSSGPSHGYTVASGQSIYEYVPGYGLQLSDVWLGKLSTPVDSSIATYPVLFYPTLGAYEGAELYNYGLSNRVGRNVLDDVGIVNVGGVIGISYIFDYDNNDDPDVGGDETRLAAGDSGGPSFVVCQGQLALLGIHWFIYDADPEEGVPSPGSGDSFVPYYIDALNDAMDGESISTVPEPATVGLLALGGMVLLIRRRRKI